MAKKARQGSRVPRKVLAMMLSSHNHMEFVEVTARIAQTKDDTFVADLPEIEKAARRNMRAAGDRFGAWGDSADQFELFHAVSAAYDPIARGRVLSVVQVPIKEVADWSGVGDQEEAV